MTFERRTPPATVLSALVLLGLAPEGDVPAAGILNPADDFELVIDIAESLSLRLQHDAERAVFSVSVLVPDPEPSSFRLLFALRFNRAIPADRRFAYDVEARRFSLDAELAVGETDPERLGVRIAEMVALAADFRDARDLDAPHAENRAAEGPGSDMMLMRG